MRAACFSSQSETGPQLTARLFSYAFPPDFPPWAVLFENRKILKRAKAAIRHTAIILFINYSAGYSSGRDSEPANVKAARRNALFKAFKKDIYLGLHFTRDAVAVKRGERLKQKRQTDIAGHFLFFKADHT